MSAINLPLSGPPLYRYIPGAGRVPVAFNGPTGPTGGVQQINRFLRVDQTYGNDTTAAANKYSIPFQTINGAISNVASGETIAVYPGSYSEKITIPTGVAIRGHNLQQCVLQQLNCSSNTTLVTFGSNTRLEDMTLTLTSSSNVDLIGLDWPTGTTQSGRFRNGSLSVTSTASGSCSVIGGRSAGTGGAASVTAAAIRACTLRVTASGSGTKRGILVNASNTFAIRDTVIDVSGTASDLVGVETTNAGAVFDAKTSTISGGLYDINQTAGAIRLGLSDLVNNNASGNGFSVTTEPSHLLFVLGPKVDFTGQGSLSNTPAGTYYMSPGTSLANFSSNIVGIPFPQRVIIFDGVVSSTVAIPAGRDVIVTLYKSTTPDVLGTSFKSATLNSTNQNVIINNFASTFETSNYFQARCDISGGSLTAGTNICIAIGLF
jgi:hypothetical protein